MSRQIPLCGIVAAIGFVILLGCQPQQPFYLKHVDGDLNHYVGKATDIEYPDVNADRLGDVANAQRPFSLANKDTKNTWNLSLEEAIQISLKNSKVIRSIGGQIQGAPDFLLRNADAAPTIYDPALAETDPRGSAEAALSAFDAQLSTSLLWNSTDAPQNVGPDPTLLNLFPSVSEHDLATFQAKLQKTTAEGGAFSLAHNVAYDRDRFNYPTQRLLYSADWNVNLTAEMRQPLLQGAGTQFNRIAGPGATPGSFNGVVIARINTDIRLAEFEAEVRNLVADVESTYWELYFAYRNLDAAIAGRESALATWRKANTLYNGGRDSSKGGEASTEAQARANLYNFQISVQAALSSNGQVTFGASPSAGTPGVYHVEAKLRYLMGLAANDGRLIRPKDEPTTAKVSFDWNEVLSEGLARSVELRQQKWMVKRRELELIAAKNFLLPKLDLVAQYRWLGMGNRLDGSGSLDLDPDAISTGDTNAYRTMTGGQYQEWQLGFQGSLPLGFRREMAGVSNAELQVTRERAKLQEGELELAHQLDFAIRDIETDYVLTETAFNQRIATKQEVEAVQTAYEQGTITIDVLLQAQRDAARADTDYFRSLVNYNKAISQVHFRKGSLLEYNGVYLAEGPWPGKAYFDARRLARSRDASTYLDYGFTQPRVMSRGPIEQQIGSGVMNQGGESGDTPAEAAKQSELVPTPEPETMRPSPDPVPPPAPEPLAEPGASTSGSRRTAPGWTTAVPRASSASPVDRQVKATGWTVAEKEQQP